ncbi:MAG TPA: radical SAM family heme chaperone HemW [Gemmatimonadales bacterium]|nr:radical SAM family heme chaperone HemW [Gemmatimonadales bacterium]
MHLYVHVPFCARRCSYCDFSIAVRREVPSKVFVDAVLAEAEALRRWGAGALNSALIDTLYFGGGTPSHLDPSELSRLIEGLLGAGPTTHDSRPVVRELTLETNPDDVTPERAAAWVRAGVDRVSLGVQSFDPAVLTWMHRVHTSEQAREALKTLRGEGIANISLDLIYALPGELTRDWGRDLDAALALEPDHLSLYGLTVEPHTPLARWVEGKKAKVADDDRYATEFLLAHERLTAAGFEHYEVSNYGKPGRRAIHNSAYWQRRPFLGLGPSAHSAMGERRWWNVREYAAWLETGGETARRRDGEDFPPTVAGWETIDADRRRIEDLYLGLRTSDGLAKDYLPERTYRPWLNEGWADLREGRIVLTAEGWLRLDALVAQVA